MYTNDDAIEFENKHKKEHNIEYKNSLSSATLNNGSLEVSIFIDMVYCVTKVKFFSVLAI
jgi:hypothetical protein